MKSKIQFSLIAYILLFLVQISIGYIQSKLGFEFKTSTKSRTEEYLNNIWIMSVGILIAPVIEELVFRKWLWGFLKMWIPNIYLSALIVSIIFGWIHGSTNFIPLICTGLIYCALYHKTQSILTNMVTHSLYNGTIIILQIILMKGT
ncbi:CPBP family intramembrane glutamic endopeptidase [Mammaliicoccus sciuri]|uniref:CPBP family intramembrane metalloprotease n=1 Tax=Mammaliicoccus sciuri TaxID=1296 RepID=A0AAI8GV71_MAMSC|nr:CPBP family intramembrane glutamic endopeptidase [Mammaliicoccus sciuri]ASE35670.1 CPBP family intramembrane metalloprotease [Mammaliicoccus sciuri]